MANNADKVSTGISSLDKILEGGFNRGDTILVAGQPGAGKTTLGLQFLLNGATEKGEIGVYVTFVESVDKLKRDALKFGWNFEKLIKEKKVGFLDLIQAMGEKGVEANFSVMMMEIANVSAKRVVIDSLSAMTTYFETKADARTFIGVLNSFLEKAGCTSILLVEVPWGKSEIGSGFEEFLADGLIVLESAIDHFRVRRMLFVPKMRGCNHDLSCYDFFISADGIAVSPIPTARK
ncbi:AAA family ATPase [Candidatus Bathyarchaeota archaeon]|nr:AAA family ATPase [Candidatus Bathyarchaeota archaeon]